MNLIGMLRALLSTGPGLSWKSVRYALLRDRQDRDYLPRRTTNTATRPGKMQNAVPIPNGARFQFSQSSLEIIFLAPDLVRLSWETGLPPLLYALAKEEWSGVEVNLSPAATGFSLSSQSMTINLANDGRSSFVNASGQVLRAELPPEWQGESWSHQARLASGECITGLGERAVPLDRRHRSYQMWNTDPAGGYHPGEDPLYICIPVYLSLQEQGSYLVFYENSFPASFHFEGSPFDPLETSKVEFVAGMLRYYFVPGPPDRALKRFTELTGRALLPPHWALGYHQSRWGYHTEKEIREVAAGFREHDLPLSAIHLDIDYMQDYRIFTVDPKRFPDLAGLARDLRASGIHRKIPPCSTSTMPFSWEMPSW